MLVPSRASGVLGAGRGPWLVARPSSSPKALVDDAGATCKHHQGHGGKCGDERDLGYLETALPARELVGRVERQPEQDDKPRQHNPEHRTAPTPVSPRPTPT